MYGWVTGKALPGGERGGERREGALGKSPREGDSAKGWGKRKGS